MQRNFRIRIYILWARFRPFICTSVLLINLWGWYHHPSGIPEVGNIYMPKITQLGGSKLYLIIFSVVNQLQTGSFKNLFLLFWANFQVLNSSLTQMWVAAGFLWCYILVFWNFSFHFSFILYDFWSKNQVATWISSTHSYAVLKGIIAQWLRAWMLGPKLPVFQSWLCLLLAVWIDLSVP